MWGEGRAQEREERPGGNEEDRERLGWVGTGQWRGEGGTDEIREGAGCAGMAEEEEEGVRSNCRAWHGGQECSGGTGSAWGCLC